MRQLPPKTVRRIALSAQLSVEIVANDRKIRNFAPAHALERRAPSKRSGGVWRAHPHTGSCRIRQEDVDRAVDTEDVTDALHSIPTKSGRLADSPSIEGRSVSDGEQFHLFRFRKTPGLGDAEKTSARPVR